MSLKRRKPKRIPKKSSEIRHDVDDGEETPVLHDKTAAASEN